MKTNHLCVVLLISFFSSFFVEKKKKRKERKEEEMREKFRERERKEKGRSKRKEEMEHSWANALTKDSTTTATYGNALAAKVAKALKDKGPCVNSHRDYCGKGLAFVDGKFLYGSVNDGYLDNVDMEWVDDKEFVEWLASQSDWSLSGIDSTLPGYEKEPFGRNNQRITKDRLEDFVA